MKKSISTIVLLSVLSVSAYASEKQEKEFNFYPKVGAAVYSKYTGILGSEQTSTSGIVLSPTTTSGGHNLKLALEATRDISPRVEVGLGIAYITNGKEATQYKSTIETKDFGYATCSDGVSDKATCAAENIVEQKWATGQVESNFTLTMPRYRSIPFYVTTKYNFETNSEFKPYIKADLGYALNKIKNADSVLVEKVSNIQLTAESQASRDEAKSAIENFEQLKQSPYWEFIKDMPATAQLEQQSQEAAQFLAEIENRTTPFTTVSPAEIKLKMKHGIYLGAGVGFEYKKALFEVTYHKTFTKLVDQISGHGYKYNNDQVTLSVGYRF